MVVTWNQLKAFSHADTHEPLKTHVLFCFSKAFLQTDFFKGNDESPRLTREEVAIDLPMFFCRNPSAHADAVQRMNELFAAFFDDGKSWSDQKLAFLLSSTAMRLCVARPTPLEVVRLTEALLWPAVELSTMSVLTNAHSSFVGMCRRVVTDGLKALLRTGQHAKVVLFMETGHSRVTTLITRDVAGLIYAEACIHVGKFAAAASELVNNNPTSLRLIEIVMRSSDTCALLLSDYKRDIADFRQTALMHIPERRLSTPDLAYRYFVTGEPLAAIQQLHNMLATPQRYLNMAENFLQLHDIAGVDAALSAAMEENKTQIASTRIHNYICWATTLHPKELEVRATLLSAKVRAHHFLPQERCSQTKPPLQFVQDGDYNCALIAEVITMLTAVLPIAEETFGPASPVVHELHQRFAQHNELMLTLVQHGPTSNWQNHFTAAMLQRAQSIELRIAATHLDE